MREALGLDELKRVYGRIAQRYDVQHSLITARADQRGRELLVEKSVKEGDRILDCGAGTGTTGLLALKKAGPKGRLTMFDLSEGMLSVAKEKAAKEGFADRVNFQCGDLAHLPFETGGFDVVLSTYSLCPLYDPQKGALELYRVTRPGGRIGVAHSAEPPNRVMRWVGSRVENWAWRFPSLSMGCRAVNVRPAFEKAGGKVIFSNLIGVPLWPFSVLVVEKPPV